MFDYNFKNNEEVYSFLNKKYNKEVSLYNVFKYQTIDNPTNLHFDTTEKFTNCIIFIKIDNDDMSHTYDLLLPSLYEKETVEDKLVFDIHDFKLYNVSKDYKDESFILYENRTTTYSILKSDLSIEIKLKCLKFMFLAYPHYRVEYIC